MSDSEQWHKHEDGMWHKVERKGKVQHELKLPSFTKEVKLGITFTKINNGQG